MTNVSRRTRKLPPSEYIREELNELLANGVGRDEDLAATLKETFSRLIVQRLLEAEQADFLGRRGRYGRRDVVQRGSRNGYEPGWLRTADNPIRVRVPQVRNSGVPYRSSLLPFLNEGPVVLDRVVLQVVARALAGSVGEGLQDS
ncbi:MAG: transposase, partial [Acidimicrobiales bacterium]